MTLPADLPERLDGPSAWLGRDLAADPARWLRYLGDDDIATLERAAAHWLSLGRDPATIDAADFPLGEMAGRVAALKETLLHGIGVQTWRGLPVAEWSRETSATVFLGLGAHLGSARSQNAAGHLLGHVRDAGRRSSDPTARLYQTAERQTFHTDSADVVGLLCLANAREGGDSLLISAETLYNRLRERHPALLPRLFEPLATDRRGEVPPGADPWFEIPVFSWHAGRLTAMYQRQYIDSAQRFPDAPRLDEGQVAALDALDALADDPALHLSMRLEPGDAQFVHNHSMLHDRTAFLDWPEPARRRHLLRLWLSLEGDRELPPRFVERYGSIEIGRRGGVVTASTRPHVPLEPGNA